MRNTKLIENAKAQMVDERFDCLWPMIKTGTGGQNASACMRQSEHVLEMNRVVRRLAWDDHQLAALLECHISGAMNQIYAGAGSNCPQRSHRAGNDDHAGLWMRPRRRRCRQIIQMVQPNHFCVSRQPNPLV